MIRRSPSRNHRSKGIKVKHVLQIILLLGICFWLIYQVKHSHDKKREFDENDAKVSVKSQTAYQIPKLGRKDLHPGKDKVNQNEKLEAEDEDENIVEDEDKHEHNEHEEEGNRHESEEKEDVEHGMRGGGAEEEEDENKNEDTEDERGGGDDEIDENDQEKPEVDTGRDEEFVDEEKEKEKEEEGDKKENENNENEDEEKEGSVEDHNSHEAREEQYKGDDASSAVTHDTHTTGIVTETVSLKNSDVNSEMSITKLENKPNYTEESNRNQPSSDFKVTKFALTGGTSSNANSGKESGNNSLSNPVDSSHLDNTASTYSDGHSEANSNLTIVIPKVINNMTGTVANTLSEQDKMVIFSEANQAENDTVNTTITEDVKNVQTEGLGQGGNRVFEENLPGSNLTVPVVIENGDAAGGELEKKRRFVASNETENKGNTETSETNKIENNSYMKENTDATKDEKFEGDRQRGETSDSFAVNGTSDSVEVEHHATDSHILNGVTEVRTDLHTLPNIRNEGDNGDATATE